MKSAGITSAVSLLLAASAVAKECTKSNAKDWPTSGVEACMGNAECIAIVLDGQCNSSGLADSGDIQCVKQKRATLQCTSSEVCYLYTDGDLLCHNRATGDYHDENGGTGNSNTGVYTYADGQVVTNPGTGSYTRPATTSKHSSSSTTANTKVTAKTTTTGTSIQAAQASNTASTTSAATQTSGAAKLAAAVDTNLLGLGGLAAAYFAW